MSTPGSDPRIAADEPVAPDTEPRETASPYTEPRETTSALPEPHETASYTEPRDTDPRGTVPSAPTPPRIELGRPVAAGHEIGAGERGSGDAAPDGPGNDDPGGRWREIQTLFVDDPRGSVERALRTVDGELTTLITALRQRQAPPDRRVTDATAGDTERLRIAVRSCRAFWQDLTELAERLQTQDEPAVTTPPGASG